MHFGLINLHLESNQLW